MPAHATSNWGRHVRATESSWLFIVLSRCRPLRSVEIDVAPGRKLAPCFASPSFSSNHRPGEATAAVAIDRYEGLRMRGFVVADEAMRDLTQQRRHPATQSAPPPRPGGDNPDCIHDCSAYNATSAKTTIVFSHSCPEKGLHNGLPLPPCRCPRRPSRRVLCCSH